jgi:hypothetical protein
MKGDIPQTEKEYIMFMLPGFSSCGCVAFIRRGVLLFLSLNPFSGMSFMTDVQPAAYLTNQIFLQLNEGILTYMSNYLLKGIVWKNLLNHYTIIVLLQITKVLKELY